MSMSISVGFADNNSADRVFLFKQQHPQLPISEKRIEFYVGGDIYMLRCGSHRLVGIVVVYFGNPQFWSGGLPG